MNRRVLLVCFEVPGWGGAGTAGYQLVARLRDDGIEAGYINILTASDTIAYRKLFGESYGNPLGLADVFNLESTDPLYGPQPELARLIDAWKPDVMMGLGFIAALLMKRAAPGRPSLFLTSGCQQMKRAIIDGQVPDYLAYWRVMQRSLGRPRILCREEREAVQISDLVVTHSDLTRQLYHHFFPLHTGKIHPDVIWFSEWIHADARRHRSHSRPFGERDIDVLFVANSWSRAEKNYGLAERIATAMPEATVHVVGEVDRRISGVTHHGMIPDRGALFALMGRSKVVASPSAFDAAPGVLFEASAMGCNVVASPNCGNYHLCHEELRAPACDVPSFVRSIAQGCTAKYDDNMTTFLNAGSYANLVETLAVV